jgi:hypothetical protein
MARGDDHRAREVRAALLCRQRVDLLAVLAEPLERLRLLAEDHLRAVLEALLHAEVDELLAEDLRVSGDVVDVLLRVRRRDLAPELLKALHDPHRRVAMSRVVGRGQPDRARAEDRDVDDVAGFAHAVMLTAPWLSTAPLRSRSYWGRFEMRT